MCQAFALINNCQFAASTGDVVKIMVDTAEMEGVKLALGWVREAVPRGGGPVRICTDCKAIVGGLVSPANTDDV